MNIHFVFPGDEIVIYKKNEMKTAAKVLEVTSEYIKIEYKNVKDEIEQKTIWRENIDDYCIRFKAIN